MQNVLRQFLSMPKGRGHNVSIHEKFYPGLMGEGGGGGKKS